MDATLNTIAAQPIYVLIFVAFMGFMWMQHKSSVATAVQAEAINSALKIAALGQQDANRLRDETNKQNERWLTAFDTINERFIMSITGQTKAIVQQGTRLDTIDTSLSSLPKLAASAEGSDAKTDLIVAAIQSNGVDIQAVNRKLGYMGVDMKSIAQYIVNPTAPNKQDVQDIANKPATITPAAETPAPASEALTLPVTVTLTAADTPVTPA